MDIGWVQVILTLSECVAPVGKSVCQQQQLELQFLTKTDCEYALQQMIAAKDELDYVIVNREKSGCAPSAAKTETFTSLEAVSEANSNNAGWRAPGSTDARRAAVNDNHDDRLASLKSCDETGGKTPCSVGQIIVEQPGGESVEVWRRD